MMREGVELDHITIVLNRPRYPENIGAAARAMRNMGVNKLVVVAPQNCDLTRIVKMATHAAIDVIEEMQVFETLTEALATFNLVVGTTARLGRQRTVIESPARLAQELISISRNNKVAVLFGPEDRGLTNEDIRFCQWLVNIPTADVCVSQSGAGRHGHLLRTFRGQPGDARHLCPPSGKPS